MEYDAQGMQTRFISRLPGAEADYRYLYGPGDRRLVTFDTTTGERVFKLRGQGDEVLREYSVNGWGSAGGGSPGEGWVHVKDFLYGPEGVFATRQRNGDTMYLHKDHLGTPRALTDGNGNLVGRHDYYPFGSEIPRTGQADEPTKKYTGHERDPHGLADYMLGRTYLYPFMRFATPDVARDGWNLYAYTGGNPVNRVDPDGQLSIFVAASLDPSSLDDPLNQPQLPSLREVASFVLSLIPGIGDAKDVQEALSGVDLVTGEELSSRDRALTGVAAALPIVGGKMVREGAQAAARGGDEVVDATTSVAPTRSIGPKVEKQLGSRGWTHDSIGEAVSTGEQIEVFCLSWRNFYWLHNTETEGIPK